MTFDPATLVQTVPPGALALYLDCGTEDAIQLHDQASGHDLLAARHIDPGFFLGPGSHDYEFWVPRVPVSLAFLRDHTAAAR
jgi:S-formylglutathione hydrolase FrmB